MKLFKLLGGGEGIVTIIFGGQYNIKLYFIFIFQMKLRIVIVTQFQKRFN